MIDLTKAREIAKARFVEIADEVSFEPIFFDEPILSRECGWAFAYTSKAYHETGDFLHAVAGNSPIIVLAQDGRVIEPGTARSIEDYMDEIERQLNE